MNTKLLIKEKSCKDYETPAARELDLLIEGILCSSTTMTINDWEYDGETL